MAQKNRWGLPTPCRSVYVVGVTDETILLELEPEAERLLNRHLD